MISSDIITPIMYICDSKHSYVYTIDFSIFSAIIALSILLGWVIGINYMKFIRGKL